MTRRKAAHLMCGSKLWTVVAFVSCAYFARVAYVRLQGPTFGWPHDLLYIIAHFVWVLFMAGLISESRCWKERLFFSPVLVNSGMAFVMGLWPGASPEAVDRTRITSAALWAMAAVVSLLLVFSRGDKASTTEQSQQRHA